MGAVHWITRMTLFQIIPVWKGGRVTIIIVTRIIYIESSETSKWRTKLDTEKKEYIKHIFLYAKK